MEDGLWIGGQHEIGVDQRHDLRHRDGTDTPRNSPLHRFGSSSTALSLTEHRHPRHPIPHHIPVSCIDCLSGPLRLPDPSPPSLPSQPFPGEWVSVVR